MACKVGENLSLAALGLQVHLTAVLIRTYNNKVLAACHYIKFGGCVKFKNV
jgi:hypothetical protein